MVKGCIHISKKHVKAIELGLRSRKNFHPHEHVFKAIYDFAFLFAKNVNEVKEIPDGVTHILNAGSFLAWRLSIKTPFDNLDLVEFNQRSVDFWVRENFDFGKIRFGKAVCDIRIKIAGFDNEVYLQRSDLDQISDLNAFVKDKI